MRKRLCPSLTFMRLFLFLLFFLVAGWFNEPIHVLIFARYHR